MLAAVSSVLILGYTLVYAAVANGGALARNPWLALTHDAYAIGPNGQASTSTTSTFDSILGWSTKIVGWVGGAVSNPVGTGVSVGETILGWLP